jgi:hypothetical protein
MKQLSEKSISLIVVLMCAAVCASAQTKATKFRIENETNAVFGALFVTVDGVEKKISDQAQQAWIINDGLHVVYSSSDGSGGYEGEGQSLHIYDVRTLKQKKIMSQYFMVDKLEEVVTSQKKRALIVMLEDGGLGASYVSVVDPWRGEVFFRRWARILSRNGDTMVLGFYKEDDWEKLDGEPPVKVKPYKTERHNLNTLLLRRVIVNKPDKI